MPGDLPNAGLEPSTPASPALADGFFTTVKKVLESPNLGHTLLQLLSSVVVA